MRAATRRKVWWIAGTAGFVVLLTVAMLVPRANSADAKMEEALNEIFERYDFQRPAKSEVLARWGKVPGATYRADGLTAAEADSILNTIKTACQNCTINVGGRHWGSDRYLIGTGKAHLSIPEIWVFTSFDIFSPVPANDWSVSIWVSRRTPTVLDRLKNLWPW